MTPRNSLVKGEHVLRAPNARVTLQRWAAGLAVVSLAWLLAWLLDPVVPGAASVHPVEQLGLLTMLAGIPGAALAAFLGLLRPSGRAVGATRWVLTLGFSAYLALVGWIVSFLNVDLLCGTGGQYGACTTTAVVRLVGLVGAAGICAAAASIELLIMRSRS